MAMEPERSKALHNFSMPYLKWGQQRFLRCVKVAADEPPMLDHRRSSSQPDPHNASKRKANATTTTITTCSDIDNLSNIDAVREKLMVDLRVATDKLKVSIFEEGVANNNNNNNHPRPWNLRTRRAACKTPPPPPPHREDQPQRKNLHSAPEAAAKENPRSLEQKQIGERPKFSVSLSKAEVEHDFRALVGTKPPRRPKKRPRIVQRQLDTLFPGLWFTEVTAESYKVPDVPE